MQQNKAIQALSLKQTRMSHCESITAMGTRCKCYALPGSKICVMHAKMQERIQTHEEEVDIPVFAPAIPQVIAPTMAPMQEMSDNHITE